ncbi:hypothetical protein AgCh_017037 [Apium graveolens]
MWFGEGVVVISTESTTPTSPGQTTLDASTDRGLDVIQGQDEEEIEEGRIDERDAHAKFKPTFKYNEEEIRVTEDEEFKDGDAFLDDCLLCAT